MIHKPLILIVDDEPAILQILKASLEDEQFDVHTLEDGNKAIEAIGRLVPDVVLLDIFLPKCNGIHLLQQIKKEYPLQKIIMISGYGTIPIAIDALHKGAMDFIEKPLNLDEVLTKLSCLKTPDKTLNNEDIVANDYASVGIVGMSSLFKELVHHAALIAPLNLPLLIYGPTGSGKSLFARYIHKKSLYASQDFMMLNCAAYRNIPQEMFEKRGTLFLKNIHELTLEAQKQVLSFIEDNNNTQLRIIASSIPEWFKFMQEGRLNKSLFCRLNQTPLEIPSINKRRYDIPLLVNYFLQQSNMLYGKEIALSPTAVRFLRNYNWHDDVAHIKQFIDMIIKSINASKYVIQVKDFNKFLPEEPKEFIQEQYFLRGNSLEHATNAFQQRYLTHLLKTYRYDMQQLAEFLKMPVAQLQNKMEQLQISDR